ncbi:MAG: hypothetical protein PVSMB3_17260 [Candidatus Dormibacteraceae bacterium]
MRRAALLAGAVVTYMVAAWMVAPGFYDGFAPPQPYNFACPPPQAVGTQKPASGHADIKVVGGVSEAGSAFTNDAQIVLGFLPGAFDGAGKTTISVDVAPITTCPQPRPPGIQLVTNVYRATANAPLVKPSNVVLVYSNVLPQPSAIYLAASPDGPWTSIGANKEAMPWTITTRTKSVGYFAAGYPVSSAPQGAVRVGGGQMLPIVVAILIALVLLAGIPLAMLRRRRAGGEVEAEEEEV